MRYKTYVIIFLTVLVGGTLITGFNIAVDKIDNLEFCISCHYVRATLYPEYKQSTHYKNRSGVRAECDDCHVPKPFIPLVLSKINASKHIYHHLIGSIDTLEKFEAKRLTLAKREWQRMKETDSRECRSCHNEKAMDFSLQKLRARELHRDAEENNETCIDCHKGITHKQVHKELEQEEKEEEDFML
ncbi:NapC/NirT family cytochrome c [Methyloprofundus sp.]|uniref:NapC/NirT family cytochrome c n=1 Tax=Methyloprofundus sp. TaxID=2020875 RepID=UPI003D09DEED